MASFIHMRNHTAYSLAEGAIKVKDLVKAAVNAGMPAVAMTDTGNLFGALEFALAAKDAGVQPIIGCQLGLAMGTEITEAPRPGAAVARDPDQIVLLAQNEVGYRNLLALSSRAYLTGDGVSKPKVDFADLHQRADGLLCLIGPPESPIGHALAQGQKDKARAWLEEFRRLFGDRLYVELHRHGMPEQRRIEADLVDLADSHNIPLLASNDCLFMGPDMYEAHDILLCIAQGVVISQDERRRVTPEHWFKPATDMRSLFADLPDAADNTLIAAQRCAYFPTPIKPILPTYEPSAGRDEGEELVVQARAGLERRLAVSVFTNAMSEAERQQIAKPYFDRLALECSIIRDMGFPGYFLIVADFIHWAKQQGIPVGPGRGSGAGSVVAWALTITDLDPLRFGLLFERFLNPERVSMPDFDIDFCQDRREEMIQYVQDKYGHDRVAQIITFGKMQARAVLRDVGRVLQMPFPQVDRICKLVPNNPANPVTLKQAIDGEPLLRAQIDSDENVQRLTEIALRLEGLYRHASTHAAGVVIGDRGLDELVPLYRDPRSTMPVTQFNMKWVELAGLVKFDFLGLKTLSVLTTALQLMADGGHVVDLETLALDDALTYEMLSRGESTGVFQLESTGMRNMLKEMKPNRFEDIIALVALYRPGPMDNIPRYIAVKDGKEAPDYLHPALKPILEETFGIMIYQEQVMQVAQVLAGYSLGGADLLRRAMGKKIKEEMDKQRVIFIDGAAEKHHVPAEQASQIFDQVNKFAGYGFNKSHAAAYAMIAYQTGYLKANHPVAFVAASMTYDIGNTDKLNIFRQELDRLGIPLLQPDINHSGTVFRVETLPSGKQGVRYALAAIKGVGEAAMRAVVQERAENGLFTDPFDAMERIGTKYLNKRQLERLIAAGAFDSLNDNRQQLIKGIDTLLAHAQEAGERANSMMSDLFADQPQPLPPLPVVDDWPPLERLGHEFEAIGFYLSAHPLDSSADALRMMRVVPLKSLAAAAQGGTSSRRRMAVIVVARQFRRTKQGNPFAIVTGSDPTGLFEFWIFAETLATCRDILEAGKALLMDVDVGQQNDELRITAAKVEDLETALAAVGNEIVLDLKSSAVVATVRGVVDRLETGRHRIKLTVPLDDGNRLSLAVPGSFNLGAKERQALKSLAGIAAIHQNVVR